MDHAPELLEGLQDLVVPEDARPVLQEIGLARGVGDADRVVFGELQDLVGGVGEGSIFGDAKELHLAGGRGCHPDEPPRDMNEERMIDDARPEVGLAP